jgi:hypothetical protein
MSETNETRCLGCGCTDVAPCFGQLTETGTCFWTWLSDDDKFGLCSACAALPIAELE